MSNCDSFKIVQIGQSAATFQIGMSSTTNPDECKDVGLQVFGNPKQSAIDFIKLFKKGLYMIK